MTQLGSTTSTCGAQWKMWLIKVFSVIYVSAVCAAQDPQDVTAFPDVFKTEGVPIQTAAPTVYKPPVPSVQRFPPWSEVFPSEKVTFSCDVIDSSDWTIIWKVNYERLSKTDPHLSFSPNGSVLTITAMSEDQSGNYSCVGQHKVKKVFTEESDFLELMVDENKPKPTVTSSFTSEKMFTGESVTFTCAVSVSSGWEYTWFHNGQEVQASDTYTIPSVGPANSGQYHCQAKRGSPPVHTAQSDRITLDVSEIPVPSLTNLTSWLDVFPTESVRLGCGMETGSSDWTYTWYKDGQMVQAGNTVSLDTDRAVLSISSASASHAGRYQCTGRRKDRAVTSSESTGLTLTVYGTKPRVELVQDPEYTVMFPGERVSFRCHIDVSTGWEFVWYKDNTDLGSTENMYSVDSVSTTDSGSYTCKAKRGQGPVFSTDPSQTKHIEVKKDKPKPVMTQVPNFDKVYTGESLTFICTVDISSGWEYLWYKDGTELPTTGRNLTINDAKSSDSGVYKCKARRSKTMFNTEESEPKDLNISEIPVPSLTNLTSWLDVFPTESVRLGCGMEAGSSDWTYTWYKDGQVVQAGNTVSLDADGAVLSISSASASQAGRYQCTGRCKDRAVTSSESTGLTLTVYGTKPRVELVQDPEYTVMFSGERVSFRCHIDVSTGWEFVWYKDNTDLGSNENMYSVDSVSTTDSGSYTCKAKRGQGPVFSTDPSQTKHIEVKKDKPKPVMTQVPNFDKVYTGESLTFICTVDISSGWEYLWYKDGTELPTTGRNLTINDAKSSDSGVYKCKARRSKTMFNTEESEPKDLNISEIPVPSLTNLTSWLDVFTDETVRLGCGMEAGSSDWTYTWYKDGHMIQAGNTVSLDTDGAALSISSASGSHVGHYQCTGKRKDRTVTSSRSTGLTLTVSERPSASIILLTGWSEVFSTENLVLKCVVDSQDQWNYTWFKQDVEISPPSSERHSVTPQNDPDQSLYVCQGIRDGRPNYSKKSDSFKTSNLLLKRRVLLSISGCLFFGLVAVFIGCIVLRVTRKPAEDLEKQEETNLFLTMAELKERGDAPCPLVEYITDADMKDLSKEPEENGTICSESTPLPTVDEAGPSESNDTTESNGGMVSFKQ
ncbi:titin isoform X2 [Sphaeramia orbicularis]|uniref:titin isoform X2 n=1 Tax=Sphaeramia orbicularis TaxID=375764 RepID=UPI00117C00BB|nr:titin-like isoform X2 [Sphaeramia orbicularis]